MDLSFQPTVRGLTVLFRHRACGIPKQAALFMAFALGLLAQQPPPTLALSISVASAPAGGTTQIQIFSTTPELVTTGGFSIDLDPTVFGTVANAAVFSATGDAQGYVDVLGTGASGQQLVTNF